MSSQKFLYHHHFFHMGTRIFLIFLLIGSAIALENVTTTKIQKNISTTKLTPIINHENKSIPFYLTTSTTNIIENLTEQTESPTEQLVLIKIPNEILADATLVNFTVTKHVGQTTKSIPKELLTTTPTTTITTTAAKIIVTTPTPSAAVTFIDNITTKINHSNNNSTVESLKNYEKDDFIDQSNITTKFDDQLLDNLQTENNYVENLPTTTTEEYHFDLSSYTDEYKLNKSNEPINNNDKYQLTTDSTLNQSENKISTSSEELNFSSEQLQEKSNLKNYEKTYPKENFTTLSTEIGNKNYEANFNQIILTTPSTLDFDEIHKTYKNSDETDSTESDNKSSSYRQKSGRLVNINDENDDDNDNDNVDFLKINKNSTNEHNTTTYYNNGQIEDSKYDISTNEIHNRTIHDDVDINGTVIVHSDNNNDDDDHASLVEMINGTVVLINPKDNNNNMTIPNSAEVWALASMKNIEHNQIREGQYVNITSSKADDDDTTLVLKSPQNGTLVSKQLADWVEVMKHTEFTNSSFGNSDRINGTLPTVKSPTKLVTSADSSSQENQIVSVHVSPEVLIPQTTQMTTKTTESPLSPILPILIPKQAINFTKFEVTTLKADDHQHLNEDIEPINVKQHLENSNNKENSHQHDDEHLSSNVLLNDHTNKHESTDNLLSLQNDKFNIHDFTTDKINQLQTTFAPLPNLMHENFTDMIANDNNDPDNEDHDDNDDDNNIDIVTTTTIPITTIADENIDENTTDFPENDMETTLNPEMISIKNTQSPIVSTTLAVITTPTTTPTTTTTTATTPSTTHTTSTTSTTTTPSSTIIIQEIKTTTPTQIHTEETTLPNESSIINAQHEDSNDDDNSNEIHQIHNNEINYPSKINSSNSDKNILMKNDENADDDHDRNNQNEDNDNENDKTNDSPANHGDDDNNDSDGDDANDDDNDNSGIMFQPIIENTTSISFKVGNKETKNTNLPEELGVTNEAESSDTVAVIGIAVGVCAAVCLIILIAFILIMRKRRKQLTYGQRCRPVGLDAYSLDNVSVYNSVRRKGALRQSKRAYANAAFDDPSFKSNLLTIPTLAKMVGNQLEIYKEFKELPTVTARIDEVPDGCEDKNRYANIVPLPETRVNLKQLNNDDKTEYINANFVKGPTDVTPYYIACQAPIENTIGDFWRMIWEQNSRVIIMATDLIENGIEKCAEYIPPSVVLDNYRAFGDFQITLKSREVKDKYAVSIIHLQNTITNSWRELNHLWYQWPLNDNTVPIDESTIISLLLETRKYLKISSIDQSGEQEQNESEETTEATTPTSTTPTTTTITTVNENGNIPNELKFKSLPRQQGPLTVHCSPGTGRTGTIIGCDIALRTLDQPAHSIDIPQIVYSIRRGRASAVRTREQYEFIYKVALMYATKITGPINDN